MLVDSLIDDVRSMLDEANSSAVSDVTDILPALNRAQKYAVQILRRHYSTPLMEYKYVTSVNGQEFYDAPEEAFGHNIDAIDFIVNFRPIPCPKRSIVRAKRAEQQNTAVSLPVCFAQVGSKYRFYPASSGTYPHRVWYSLKPLPLIKSQGRITTVNTANTYIIVDTIGTDISTTADNLNNYISIIDGETGRRKASYQVLSISGNRINLRTTATRSTVLNKPIDTSLVTANLSINAVPALATSDNSPATVAIEQDDYVCVISGSCVSVFSDDFSNFLTEFAVQSLRRKLGQEGDVFEKAVLNAMEEEVKKSWVGREGVIVVHRNDNRW